jgi:3-oxoacyl-[acyl-carrier-protein] synthase II
VAGQSGIGPITRFDASAFPVRIAGEVKGFEPERWIEKKRVREGDRFIQMAIASSFMAVQDAGFEPTDEQKERVGTFIGVGFCGIELFEDTVRVLDAKGPRRITPYFIPAVVPNMAPGQVSMYLGYKGPNYTTASACASGGHAIGEALRWIQRGDMDAALAGGTESPISGVAVGGFASMRAISKRNEEPARASRPFDRDRDGFVMAEGAAVMVLEEREAALRRGARIYAELCGYGASADAYHLTQPAPEGEGGQRAMRAAIADAQLPADEVDYINAHGTSTPTGDINELLAVRAVFGQHAENGLSISSTKSVHGHLLGASGGLEAIVSVLSIRHGVVPPTMNLDDPVDEARGMDLVPNQAREKRVGAALSNSFGFGGTNVTLAFRRHE